MFDWLGDHQGIAWIAAAASAAMLIASLVLVPALVVRIPPDYFTHTRRPPGSWAHRHPAARLALRIVKNLVGVVLVLAGLAMLALPGQGLLTILVGCFLVDYPGKYRLEAWLVARPSVLKAMNWLRRRSGRAPLRVS
jgi:hypothetical protein